MWTAVDAKEGGALMYYNHASPFHTLVIRIKYWGDFDLAERMGAWACRRLGMEGWPLKVDVVVPVPAGKARWKKYGYSQTLYLARGIARELQCPVEEWLSRTDSLSSQTHRSAEERATAEMDVVASVPENRRGATVLLVDDVITTGSTMRRCALALQTADPTLNICVFALAQSQSLNDWSNP